MQPVLPRAQPSGVGNDGATRRSAVAGLQRHARGNRLLIAFLALMVVLLALHHLLPEASSGQDAVYLAAAAMTVIGLATGILVNRPRHRAAWWLLAVGQLGTVVGDVAWTIWALNGQTGLGLPADAIYLASYGLRTSGLFLLVWPRYAGRGRDGVMDIAMVSVAAAAIAWFLVLEPILLAGAADPFLTLVGVAYPVLDLVVVSVVVAAILAPGTRTISFLFLVAGLVVLLVTDGAYTFQQVTGSYVTGGALDLGWLVAYALFAAAALHPSAGATTADRDTGIRSPSVVRRVLLVAALLTGPVLLLVTPPDDVQDLVVIALTTAVLGLLVLARLLGVARRLDEDLVQRRALEARLTHQASHDPLTGLPNRRLFFDRLAQAATRRSDGAIALMFVDVDDLKAVNDSLGHDAGDRLLVAIADRLRANLRPGDLAARLGGDEFAMLVDGVADQAVAEALADRLETVIREPVPFGTTTVSVRASIGVVVQDEALEGAEDLLRAADLAMYRAKTMGKGRRVSFVPAMHAQAMQRLELRRDLAHAIGGDQIVLEYQPIVDLGAGRIDRLEALVRWNHPRYGRLVPEAFLGLAEEAGLIRELGAVILGQACREIVRLNRGRRDGHPTALSVNVAVGQLTDTGFAASVEDVLDETGLDPTLLRLEVSDSTLDRLPEAASAGLARLRSRGVRLAIDDFGGANSSIGLLRSLEADELKLDRSLVGDVDRPDGSATEPVLVRAVLDIGGALGIEIVAVGVERASQLDVLRQLGCHIAQGFLFSEAVPPARLPALLDDMALLDRARPSTSARRASDAAVRRPPDPAVRAVRPAAQPAPTEGTEPSPSPTT